MQGIYVKRGVESTLERVFNNTGRKFDTLEFAWTGRTAGVCSKKINGVITASVIFPNIDETVDVPKAVFNELIGYALHELGHVWFTDEESWDLARENHGDFVSSLINGLEDPRIERKVIDSGYAPNSQHLFENLVNAVLTKDGYVKPDDLKNVPFLLAIEGRRLNGYPLVFDSIVDQSPWASDLHWALTSAQRAKNTREIVGIAIELNKRLQQHQEQQQQQQQQQQQSKQGKQDGNQQGKSSDQQSDESNGQPSGESSDGQPDGQADGQSDKQTDGKPSDKKQKKNGSSGKGRDVEPTSFIQDRLAPHQAQCDVGSYPRPNVGKPVYDELLFR
jgi:hypothetical protein